MNSCIDEHMWEIQMKQGPKINTSFILDPSMYKYGPPSTEKIMDSSWSPYFKFGLGNSIMTNFIPTPGKYQLPSYENHFFQHSLKGTAPNSCFSPITKPNELLPLKKVSYHFKVWRSRDRLIQILTLFPQLIHNLWFM